MTKRARLFLQSTLLATLMAGLFVRDASAGAITITFGGTVTGPGTGATLPSNSQGDPVVVGDTISGYFTYNSGGAGNGTYSFVGTGQTLLFSIPVANNTTFGDQNNNASPNNVYQIVTTGTGKGATLNMQADMTSAGGKPAGKTTIDLIFTSTNAAYTGGLPASAAAFTSDFSGPAKFFWDPGNVGIGGNIAVTGVPEPSSVILMGVAMATLGMGLAISRRKLARA
jgi:hypothetical protein